MNQAFLGDALDFWKGSILTRLQQAAALRNLRIDGMFTDAPWGQPSLELYASLLGQPVDAIIPHDSHLIDRQAYFAEIPAAGDLFFDPDTGVRTSGSNGATHLNAAEVDNLLTSSRLVLVYQHISRIRVLDRLQRVSRYLHDHIAGLHCCTANSATVALLFLSRSAQRTHAISSALRQIYGPKAGVRTSVWPDA